MSRFYVFMFLVLMFQHTDGTARQLVPLFLSLALAINLAASEASASAGSASSLYLQAGALGLLLRCYHKR